MLNIVGIQDDHLSVRESMNSLGLLGENLVSEDCLLLTACLGLCQCLVHCCVSLLKDFSLTKSLCMCLQCFDSVGLASGRASGL